MVMAIKSFVSLISSINFTMQFHNAILIMNIHKFIIAYILEAEVLPVESGSNRPGGGLIRHHRPRPTSQAHPWPNCSKRLLSSVHWTSRELHRRAERTDALWQLDLPAKDARSKRG